MIIDRINLNHLRIFETVYRTQNMTTAAGELHLTQSGVSQHMRSLETAVGVALFDRIRKKLVPTSSAEILYRRCVDGLSGIEYALSEMKGVKNQLSGLVSIGMPVAFGNNCVISHLAEFSKRHPLVRFDIRYGYAFEMNEALLKGELDFAFVDAFGLDKRIQLKKIYDEKLYLCATKKFLKRFGKVRETGDYFESLQYVCYLKGEPVLRMWFEHHLKTRRLRLNVQAAVRDVQGVSGFILSGAVCGVLPDHFIKRLGRQGEKLYCFKGGDAPLKNSISLAYLDQRTHPQRVTAAIDYLTHRLSHRINDTSS